MCDTCSWEDFVAESADLIERIEDLPDACDAAESWAEKIESMKAWAKDNEHVTDKMETAFDAIESGVARWERD